MRWLINGSIGFLVWLSWGIPACFANSEVQSVPNLITQMNSQASPQPSSPLKRLSQPLKPEQFSSKPTVLTVRSTEEIRLKLAHLPTTNEGTLSVFLNQVDVTSQVAITGNELVYRSRLLPLTPGEHTLTVYMVKSAEQWIVLETFVLKVDPTTAQTPQSSNQSSSTPQPVTPNSDPSRPANSSPETPKTPEQPTSETPKPTTTRAEDLKFTPKLNVNFKSQVAEARTPDAGRSERPTFADLALTGGFAAQYQRDNFNVQANFNLAGSTNLQEALRFNTLKEAAPQIDLSDYLLDVKVGNAQVSVGHQCYGNHPFLLDNLCSRGLSSKIQISKRVNLSIAHISTTSVVGFDNFLGIEHQNNTLTAATLGMQLLDNPAGGVRLETTFMRGARQPIENFNVGEVVDAEKSQGFGVRLFGTDPSGRLKLDAGYVRSRFTNPTADPQLVDNLTVARVQPVTRSAWFVETSYDLLKNVKLDATRTLDLSFNFRHERLDPQFGTVGASVTVDQLRTRFGVNAAIAGATIQFQTDQSEDNLANIATILKTKTQNRSLTINAPLQTILNSSNQLLPTLTYSFQRTHQFGANQPVEALSGFDPSEIPDQLTTSHKFGTAWSIDNFSLSYQYSNTFQDNRQPTRELADFSTMNHQVSIAWQVNPRLNLALGYNFTSAKSFEQGITRFTSSPTLSISWVMFPNLTLAFNYNRTDETDSLNQKITRATNLEALLTWQFQLHSLGREIPASAFIRYGTQSTIAHDPLFNVDTNATIQTVSAGLNFSF